jgi:hypothetical protein
MHAAAMHGRTPHDTLGYDALFKGGLRADLRSTYYLDVGRLLGWVTVNLNYAHPFQPVL